MLKRNKVASESPLYASRKENQGDLDEELPLDESKKMPSIVVETEE
jgi:hypothetical protein